MLWLFLVRHETFVPVFINAEVTRVAHLRVMHFTDM